MELIETKKTKNYDDIVFKYDITALRNNSKGI